MKTPKQSPFFLILSICFFLMQSICALSFEWESSTQIFSGFRNDVLVNRIQSFDPSTTPTFIDYIKVKDIRVYEIGVREEISFCTDFFIRGTAQYGSIKRGKYSERIHINGNAKNNDTVLEAKAPKGSTEDYSICLGYLFPIWKYCEMNDNLDFRFGPLLGWAWDSQRIQIDHATKTVTSFTGTPTTTPLPILNCLKYKNHWQGPWIGLEAVFTHPWIEVKAGYEYHWPHWGAEYLLAGPDVPTTAFSDKRSGRIYFGSKAYIDARHYLINGFYIEAGLRFEYWRAKNGREIPLAGTFSAVGFRDTRIDKVTKGEWQTFAVNISIGYQF